MALKGVTARSVPGAGRTVKSINVSDRPSKVVLESGLKLDAEAGALVAKASSEAGFKVVLTWERSDKKNE